MKNRNRKKPKKDRIFERVFRDGEEDLTNGSWIKSHERRRLYKHRQKGGLQRTQWAIELGLIEAGSRRLKENKHE